MPNDARAPIETSASGRLESAAQTADARHKTMVTISDARSFAIGFLPVASQLVWTLARAPAKRMRGATRIWKRLLETAAIRPATYRSTFKNSGAN